MTTGLSYPPQAPVAQLDRVLPSEGRGRTFESSRARQGIDESVERADSVRTLVRNFARPPLLGPRPSCLTFVRAAHLPQYGLDPPPGLRLLLVAGFLKGCGLLSGFCDGFGAMCFKKVACKCRNIHCICIHLRTPPNKFAENNLARLRDRRF